MSAATDWAVVVPFFNEGAGAVAFLDRVRRVLAGIEQDGPRPLAWRIICVNDGSSDETLKLWDVAAGTTIRTYEGPAAGVRVAAFSQDGRTLVSGGSRNILKVLDAASGRPVRRLHGADQYVLSAVLSPDGRVLATGGSDYDVKLWDAASGALLRKLEGHGGWVQSIAFSTCFKSAS